MKIEQNHCVRTKQLKSLVAAVAVAVVALVGCGDSGPTGPDDDFVAPPTLSSLTVEGVSSLAEGMQGQLTVTANYSDGRSRDVTGQSTYTSSNDAIAVVSGSGLVTAVRAGSAEITASYTEGSARREEMTIVMVERELPEYQLTVSVSSIRIIEDCDLGPIIQAGPGEFSYRVTTRFPEDAGSVTLTERSSRVSRSNGQSITIGRSRTERFVGDGGSINVGYRLTEWDANSADSRMNNRSGSRNHSLRNGQWSSTGSNSIQIGVNNCSAELRYSFSARRVN